MMTSYEVTKGYHEALDSPTKRLSSLRAEAKVHQRQQVLAEVMRMEHEARTHLVLAKRAHEEAEAVKSMAEEMFLGAGCNDRE